MQRLSVRLYMTCLCTQWHHLADSMHTIVFCNSRQVNTANYQLHSASRWLHICSIWQRPKNLQVCTAIHRTAGSLIHICGMCHALIHVNICPPWCVENTESLGNDEYRAKLARLRTSVLLQTTNHWSNIYQMPHMCSCFHELRCFL